MKPKTNRERKGRDIDKDTVVAYHEFIQGRIQGELNGVTIGPGHFISRLALFSFIFGLACLIVGILIVTLRHRHVYLVDWNHQFLGPFFVIMFLLCSSFSVALLLLAKRRTNQYRADLAFRPIGDYGVAVVHKSKLTYDDQKKTELKSGTTPHNVRHPGRPGVNDRGNRGDYSRSKGYDNRGYRDDTGRRDEKRDYDRGDRRERDRDNRDGRRPPDAGRRRDDDREKRRPDEDRRGPPDDRDRRRPDDDRRRPPQDGERRRPPPDDDRRRRPDDRERGDRDRRRPPPGPDDEKRREEGRRRYEEEKRRRYEEDRRRAELRKQAEAESSNQGEERGVDIEGTRTYQIQTTVKLNRGIQEIDESDL